MVTKNQAQDILNYLCRKAKLNRKVIPTLEIKQAKELNMWYASNKIIITTHDLQHCTVDELTQMMSHEIGHLIDFTKHPKRWKHTCLVNRYIITCDVRLNSFIAAIGTLLIIISIVMFVLHSTTEMISMAELVGVIGVGMSVVGSSCVLILCHHTLYHYLQHNEVMADVIGAKIIGKDKYIKNLKQTDVRKTKLRQMMVTWLANHNMYSHPSVENRIKNIENTIK